MNTQPILIVGAGPTGLVLALSLARRGVPFRLISDAKGPGEHSRAMGVHARTLEFYRQFGLADEIVSHGVIAHGVHIREAGADGASREVRAFSFNDLGQGISPYPFMLTYPQDDHERFLVGKLADAGISVEWATKLTDFTQDGGQVHATIAHEDGRTEQAGFAYVCGCDGAHSQVRRTLGVGFSGGTYDQLFYVADVRIDGDFQTDMFVSLGAHSLALMLPVRSSGMQRLIGLVPPGFSGRADITFEDIRAEVEKLLNVRVTDVNWFSTYHVHHRVADRFRIGRAFLLGDAGHIHSPVGGQGMNTGIGDAINLGWKLGDVVAGRAGASLLDSYEPERIGFARELVSTTDRVFTPIIAEGLGGEAFRRIVVPLVATVMTRFSLTRHAAFRTLSQVHIHYGDSPLSEGVAGHVHGGDRLPWTGADGPDNFIPLRSCDWQVHVYGEPETGLAETCAALVVPLHGFAWNDAADHCGFKRGAAYLVRPDGYVALAAPSGGAEKLRAYVQAHSLRF